MPKVNAGRVVLAGLVAGLVINVLDFVVNVPILSRQWDAADQVLGIRGEQVGTQAAIGWIVLDFIVGLFTAWLYAAIRPRYGAGARTGLCAGFAVWIIVHASLASTVSSGVYPLGLIAASTLGGLVANLAGGWTAGRLYREE